MPSSARTTQDWVDASMFVDVPNMPVSGSMLNKLQTPLVPRESSVAALLDDFRSIPRNRHPNNTFLIDRGLSPPRRAPVVKKSPPKKPREEPPITISCKCNCKCEINQQKYNDLLEQHQSDLDLRLRAMELKISRNRLAHGKVAAQYLRSKNLDKISKGSFHTWLRWIKLRQVLSRICRGSSRAIRSQMFDRWKRFSNLRSQAKRTRRALRYLALTNNGMYYRIYYDMWIEHTKSQKNRYHSMREASIRLLLGVHTRAIRVSFRRLGLFRLHQINVRKLQPIKDAFIARSSRLLVLKYYNKVALHRMEVRKKKGKQLAWDAFCENRSVVLRRRYLSKWLMYIRMFKSKTLKRKIAQQIGLTSSKQQMATYYQRLKRNAERNRIHSKILDGISRAHKQWLDSEGFPRLIAIETNVAGLVSQIPNQTDRLGKLERKINALLADNDQGLEAHLTDLRTRHELSQKLINSIAEEKSELELRLQNLINSMTGTTSDIDSLSAELQLLREKNDQFDSRCDQLSNIIEELMRNPPKESSGGDTFSDKLLPQILNDTRGRLDILFTYVTDRLAVVDDLCLSSMQTAPKSPPRVVPRSPPRVRIESRHSSPWRRLNISPLKGNPRGNIGAAMELPTVSPRRRTSVSPVRIVQPPRRKTEDEIIEAALNTARYMSAASSAARLLNPPVRTSILQSVVVPSPVPVTPAITPVINPVQPESGDLLQRLQQRQAARSTAYDSILSRAGIPSPR